MDLSVILDLGGSNQFKSCPQAVILLKAVPYPLPVSS